MENKTFSIPSAISDLPAVVSGFSIDHGSDNDLRELLRSVRVAQRCLNGLAIKVHQRADELAAKFGSSAASIIIKFTKENGE